MEALKSNAKEILFGGSRGGGKTDAGQAWLLYDVDKSHYRALVLRKNYTDLKEWIDRAKEMYRGLGGKYVNGMFVFPTGATIWLGHMADENSYQKYQGFNIHKLLIEELTHLGRQDSYIKLLGSVRSTHDDIDAQVFCTTNPDGPGHEWVKDRWSIPDRPGVEPIVTYIETDYGKRKLEFIPSRVSDNKYLAENEDYMSYLHSIPDEELKRAWLEGSWEGFGVEGAFYKTQIEQAYKEGRVRPNIFDPTLQVYTWCDLGIADSFAIVYMQKVHNEWRVIDYDEFEGEGLHDVRLRMQEKGYVYKQHHAPHDIQVRELGTGKSRKEMAAQLGIDYDVTPNLPIMDGINALRMRFGTLYFDEKKCKILLSRLRRYRKEFDEKRGVYKNRPVHDVNSHAADAMRYWAVTDTYDPSQFMTSIIQSNQNKRRTFK